MMFKKSIVFLFIFLLLLSCAACSFGAKDVFQSEYEKATIQPVSQETQIIEEDGAYSSKEDVASYLQAYGHLPNNFISKNEAKSLGWEGGSLEPYAPGCAIGGDRFKNFEELLPEAEGREYFECDIDTVGAKSRGAKRIVYSNDGLIYYTEDHYESFELIAGEEP